MNGRQATNTATPDYSTLIAENLNKGVKRMIIKDTNDFAWCHGLANYLINNFNTKDCNTYFIAFIDKPKGATK